MEQRSFDKVYNEKNPKNAWNALKTILVSSFNEHAPLISKRVKGKKSPWLDRAIKNEMNTRDALYRKYLKSKSTIDHENYKKQRNKVNVRVRKAKNKHSQTMLRDSTSDPKTFWRTLKKIFPTKEKLSMTKTFLIDGALSSNASVIASKFCSYFSTIARYIKEKAIPLKNFVWSKPKISFPKTYSTFRFKEIRVNDTFKCLRNLSRKKACGHDGLPPGMLKDAAIAIAKPLTHVMNLILQTGIVPFDFKHAVVSPIFKSGAKQELDNYRPVSVLPICSKIFEKSVHRQVSEYLEEKELLSSTQFGFRKKRNTELAATLLLDKIRDNTDKGHMTGAIFIDLSKAFDTLSHGQIVESLSSYGIYGTELELFTNYLFNRTQSVRVGPEISNPEKITCGVPQGSILGPLLFLITFNDIATVLKHSNIITYADDTVIYFSGKSKESIQDRLQSDFNAIADWMESMDLVTNMKKGKTEVMLFGTSQKVKNQSLDISYRFTKITNTTCYKYLGVKLDQNLSLSEHIKSVYKKASSRLYLMKRVRLQLTTDAALTLYKTMLIPIFTYCSIITSLYTETVKKRISSFERRAFHIIFNKETQKANNVLSIKTLQKRRTCIQVFSCINGNVCNNFEGYFDVMENNTRNAKRLLRLPSVKLESTKKSFKFTGAKLYNELPIEVRSATSAKMFASLFDKVFNNK